MSKLATLCREALPRLKPEALDSRELHHELYVDRAERSLKKLRLRLELDAIDAKNKLLFSGHVGSGKSSELFNLKCELEARLRATIVFFSVKEHVNLVGLDGARLLESMARALAAFLAGHGVGLPDLDERIRRASERYRRVRRQIEAAAGRAGFGGDVPLVAGKKEVRSERSTDEEHVFEAVADPAPMLELVNELIELTRARRPGSAPVVLFVDDLEKLDQATALRVFSDGLALSQVDACAVFTVPIALLYSEHHRTLLGHFDDQPTVLPIIKVRDRAGSPMEENVQRMLDIVRPRIPSLDQVLSREAFARLALSSGGVIRDLIRMLGDLCLDVVVDDREERIHEAEVAKYESAIKNDFLHQIPRDLRERLAEVRDDPTLRGGGMDAGLARLLNVAAVLEYVNDDTWFRPHPLAEHLAAPRSSDVEPS